ncbi:helicase family protein with metal-binding cysteine cluster [Leptolyngbya sp. PCC 7375]|nr:helicase family protein with metal-binding cysteine cluster [Leptolyngbya sp. PCC 7375]
MLNPIVYTENVVKDFLRYQLTAYPFADSNLYAQMRTLLNLETTRSTPLLQGPFISLSRIFLQGAKVTDLISEGIFHPHMKQLIPFPAVYGHQETAIRSIYDNKTTLVSTGTGSGKTECFLYPIISHCLKLRDRGTNDGITAVIVYPMNALAEDQLGRLRELLAGTGISFGMYVGKTVEKASQVAGKRLKDGASKADYDAAILKAQQEKRTDAIHPPEERVSREEMRKKPPRILLTNVKQLELLLTRQRDIELFDHARLDFMVFDEAHTFSGANGAETACLIRRLRTFCGKKPTETTCIATSATIADPDKGPDAGREFAARFFGIPQDQVTLVGEQYQEDVWSPKRSLPTNLNGDASNHLKYVLTAVEKDDAEAGTSVSDIYQQITGTKLNANQWQAQLYDALSTNELVYQLAKLLQAPQPLNELLRLLKERIGRTIPEEEVLIWLALGAASRKDERPLLRPVLHAFVRGVGGAVVTFPKDEERPKLWLSAEDTAGTNQDDLYRLPVLTCNTCGQHYFEHWVEDFQFTEREPGGGQAIGEVTIWRPQVQEHDGDRLLLTDRLITQDENEDIDLNENHPRSARPLHLCRYCGTLHSDRLKTCGHCGRGHSLVTLLVARQKPDHPGHLTSCLACQSQGRSRYGRYREPARPIRATTVSDVHVLAQNMLHHAERKRLLVFADNRQDAAFQAGWMQDHARRYRLRSLMYEGIDQRSISIGDLTAYLDDLLEVDDELSRSLIPEVWRVHRKEAEGVKHAEERKRFLRIQVLRELTIGTKQRIGLEPWGRLCVDYGGLHTELPFIQHWSTQTGIPADDLVQGVAALLDYARRNTMLLDREGRLFSRIWREGDFEIQRGYMPILMGVPKGLKLTRASGDNNSRVQQWLSVNGDTTARQAARNWGIPRNNIEPFFDDLWRCLTNDIKILVPSALEGRNNNRLANCEGVYQIDADKLRLTRSKGVYRCNICRRAHPRVTPRMACMTWRCSGTLEFEPESADNYDLQVLDDRFTMLRPREHSAQVPHTDREVIERIFKGENELLNTLVCTPTLEMGVDIGSLDSVLMRNIPPLPANYWQRAGRAGRRHRMAVNLAYARPASHDRAYFRDPLRLLAGQIDPPRLNLRNTLMVAKHVHATVLTVLHQLSRPQSSLSKPEQQEIADILNDCFPPQVNHYLFEDTGFVRPEPLDVSSLATLLQKHGPTLYDHVKTAFADSWPNSDRMAVEEASLKRYIATMGDDLTIVIQRLWRRLQWGRTQLERLNSLRIQKGSLDPEEDALFRRCDSLIKTLKGKRKRRSSSAEGYDDTITYGVLAAEGFLPGYGLDTGSIRGTAQIPRSINWLRDFTLPRPPSVSLREYVPGNLIYANGQRFVPRFFHLEPEEPTHFQVDVAHEAITEIGTGQVASALSAANLQAVPMCDVDLSHQSNISDDEDNRFQLPVTILGYEQDRHEGGIAFNWGTQSVQLRRNVHMRLVNVGPASLVRSNQLGYHICQVCGHSRSPFSSQADLQLFSEDHQQRCGRPVTPTGVYANIVADALSIQDCASQQVAYSVLEAIRHGASNILDMELDDLQILTVARPGSDQVDALLYDPMPGGSGLLEQLVSRWHDVVGAALEVLNNCQSQCETACIDCLFTFRNAYYHRHLNRHIAIEKLVQWEDILVRSHEITAKLPAKTDDDNHRPVNHPEALLQDMLKRAGFPDPVAQHRIDLGKPLGTTVPDFFFEDPDDRTEGLCIYLDGMSKALHGNPKTRQRDQAIREELRSEGYEVIEIPFGDLIDQAKMAKIFFRIGRALLGKTKAKDIRDRTDWFDTAQQAQATADDSVATGKTDKLSGFIAMLSTDWQTLLNNLNADEQLTLEEGKDILQEDRVIGQYLVRVYRNSQSLFLLEDTNTDASQAMAFLQTNGDKAMVVNPSDSDSYTQIMAALEEPRA